MIRVWITFFLVAFLSINSVKGQGTIEHFDSLLLQADNYKSLNLNTQAYEAYKQAKQFAQKNDLEKQYINASISMGELMRKTRDFDRGLVELKSIEGSEKYPELHVRKLGRLAAIYNEHEEYSESNRFDSLLACLNIAIPIAEQNEFFLEQALLLNEKASFIRWTEGPKEAYPMFLMASKILKELNDLENYSVVLNNIMDCQYELGMYSEARQSTREQFARIDTTNWYQIRIDAHDIIAKFAKKNGDSLTYFKHKYASEKQRSTYIQKTYIDQIASYRVLHDTELYQQQALQKEQKLQEEQSKNKQLAIFLFILGVLMIPIVALLVRERALKRAIKSRNQQLRHANDKYEMLMVESNHRIKNNLQMVISMLAFASEGLGDKESNAFNSMSGKIQTISALHKHLTLHIHNEKVDVKSYFNEIISLYKHMLTDEIVIHTHIDSIEINSERIVYFGLILNELLANSIEHHSSSTYSVSISVSKINDHFRFFYNDGSNYESSNTGTGTQLIADLIDRVEGKNLIQNSKLGIYQFDFYV